MHLDKILVPVDFSSASRKAAERGAELAKRTGAQLRLVHVNDVPPYVYSDTRTMMISGMNYQEYSVEETTRKISALSAELADLNHVRVSSGIREGAAGSEICKDAREEEADLILMPTHGRTGVSRFLLGSVAEKVVRRAECPVLTFHPDEDTLDYSRIQKILIPLDLSDEANESIEYGVRWARLFDASMELVHVLDDIASIPSLEWSVYPSEMPQEYYRTAESRARNCMEKAAAKDIQEAVPCGITIRHGFVADEVVAVASETSVDLIIASTHGHSGFRKMILGSVAERLVRTAPCPVVIVRPSE